MARRKKTAQSSKMDLLGAQLLGLVALALALLSMFGLKTSMALLAIGLGSISVWKSVRSNEYNFLFLGMAAILIGLVAIWSAANQTFAAVI